MDVIDYSKLKFNKHIKGERQLFDMEKKENSGGVKKITKRNKTWANPNVNEDGGMQLSKCKRLIISIMFLLTLIFFSGCEATNYQKSIYNDNSKIAKVADTATVGRYISNSLKKDTQNIKFGFFYGVKTFFILDSDEENTVKVNFESKIDGGKFKVVLVTPDKKVVDIFAQSKKGSATLKIPKGKSRIKIVGNNAKGKLTLTVKSDGDVNIEKPGD